MQSQRTAKIGACADLIARVYSERPKYSIEMLGSLGDDFISAGDFCNYRLYKLGYQYSCSINHPPYEYVDYVYLLFILDRLYMSVHSRCRWCFTVCATPAGSRKDTSNTHSKKKP